MVEVVHEAPPVHRVVEGREVLADPGVETGQLGGGGVVQARDLPVRKVATKQDVWETLNLHFSREVQVWQKKEMFLQLTGQARLVPLPGLPCCLHGDLDEVSQGGQINTELSGEARQSEHTLSVS